MPLIHFYHDPGSFPPARAKDDRAALSPLARGRAAAVRVPRQAELARAKLAPDQQPRRQPHNRQRNHLLPVHIVNIPAFPRRATSLFGAQQFSRSSIPSPQRGTNGARAREHVHLVKKRTGDDPAFSLSPFVPHGARERAPGAMNFVRRATAEKNEMSY
jgi:hypothetical protein